MIMGTAALAGADVKPILEEIGLTDADLADERRRVPFATVLRVVDRLAEIMGREAMIASGRSVVQTIPDFAPLARRFLQPFSLVRFICEVADQAVYPMMSFKVDMLAPLRFSIRLALPPEYGPALLFWEYCAQNLAAIPTYYGLPAARLTEAHTDHTSDLVLEWPPMPAPLLEQPAASIDGALKLLDALGVSLVQIFDAGADARTRAQHSAELDTTVQQLVVELEEPAFVVGRDGTALAANGSARHELSTGSATLAAELSGSDADLARFAVLPLLDDQRLVIRRDVPLGGRSSQAPNGEARALRRVLGLLPMPLVVLDRAGSVVCASLGAERLMAARADLAVKGGKLTSTRRDEAAAIVAAIASAADLAPRPKDEAARSPARVVELAPMTEDALGLIFMPLRPHPRDEDTSSSEGSVLVVIHDPAARVRLSPALISQLHGLTPTEGATAAAIAEGSSPAEIARARGCAEDTVRSHLKRILEKTGTHRQADLVRVLLTGAAMQLSRLE